MNVNEAFPSNYLRAADLQGREATVSISHVTMEEIGQTKEPKPVLYFTGKEKGIILNKTNATNISAAYGPDTDDWTGKFVTLFTAWVDFQGRSVEAIRVRPGGGKAAKPAVKPPVNGKPAPAQTPPAEDPDDSIPF